MKTRLFPLALITALLGIATTAEAQTFPTGIEIVAELLQPNPPGNVAVTPDGQVFMSQHQFYGTEIKVVKLLSDGSVQPFPTPEWASPPDENGIGLNNVLGIRADGNGVVWMLDNPGSGDTGRLVGWNTRTDQLHKVIYLAPPVIPENTFLNDFAVDLFNDAIYIADTAGGSNSALIVVNLKTGYTRRVLEGHASMQPEDIPIIVEGQTAMLGDAEARIGVNPITIDPSNEWVYYGPMSGTSLYRIRTADLLNQDLSSAQLASKIERFGDKPISDGITIDAGNNVY
ncbi:MAG: L-dopachrome tautomerase-related protein, partial [Cyanobacteria bacterium P01_F01_bin.3]